MPITAIYPGTFDPITLGHCDLVQRATRLFEKVVVAIAANPSKQPVFSLQERINMAINSLPQSPQISVQGFDGLLVDYAHSCGANVIIRGLRAVSDFEYEFQLAGMNRKLAADIETIFLTPAEKYAYISSSLVREVATLGGDVSPFVHTDVLAELKRRMR